MANFVMETLPKLVALSSYVASALLYALALFTGSIVVRTAQPNGLAEVQVPFYLVSFLATWTALGVFFFGVVLMLLGIVVIVRTSTHHPIVDNPADHPKT